VGAINSCSQTGDGTTRRGGGRFLHFQATLDKPARSNQALAAPVVDRF